MLVYLETIEGYGLSLVKVYGDRRKLSLATVGLARCGQFWLKSRPEFKVANN